MSPLWPSTTWNSWMRSRFSVSATSIRSASPRVPTREKLCTRWSAPKSSTAARNSRLSCARWAASRRRQAGSTCRNVYLTKWRSLTRTGYAAPTVPFPALRRARVQGLFVVLRSVSRTREPSEASLACGSMRIALVSPYSWTYPGGVTRHIEALAAQFDAGGHEVRVFSPFDPADRLSVRLHRGARPEAREAPDWLVPLGRTIGVESNGAVSNLAPTPYALTTLRNELRAMRPDVIHVHEPPAPTVGYDALDATVAPLVGTFHCYSENAVSHGIANNLFGVRRKLRRLHVRIAVSEAAAGPGRRFSGGHSRVIPNGVDVPAAVPAKAAAAGRPLRLVFVGQAVERKGLPVLLRAFEALREHMPVELVVVGAGEDQVAPLMLDTSGVHALGKVSDERKHAALAGADLLVAPSLGGESFGMVLTEGFAAGTPVVASDIAGYRDVVHDGEDGVLFPRGDATALAEALRDLALDPDRRARMAGHAATSARRYAWPTVAAEVLGAYEDAIAMRPPETARERTRVFLGAQPADGHPRVPPQRLASLEPAPRAPRSAVRKYARRAAIGVAGLGGAALSWMALQRIGLDQIGQSLLAATPWWVVVALGLMCLSMAVRGVAWRGGGGAGGGVGTLSCGGESHGCGGPGPTRCRARSSGC